MFYATRHQVYCGSDIDHMVFAIRNKHKAHTGTYSLTYKYILTPPIMCSSSYLYYLEWITHWHQKIYFNEVRNVFAFKKWITCKSHISARVQFDGSIFHDSSWGFQEPYFSWTNIFHESHRVNRAQNYGPKTCT